MRINVRGHHLQVSDSLTAFAQARVRSAFRHLASHVETVEILVTDVNGPRGGVDKKAGIQAIFEYVEPIHAEAVSADPYAAIGCAVDRLRAGAAHRIGRARTRAG